jgi:hypothetical protein
MSRGFRPSPAMAVAIVALVASFAGPALADQAVHFAKKRLDGRTIAAHSIAGSRLKNNTVTGVQVNESTLGKVPSAAHADSAATAGSAGHASNADHAGRADSAGNADTVDGLDSSQLGASPLFAVVDGEQQVPAIVRGRGTQAATRIATGDYAVVFDRDVRGCAYLVTPGDPAAGAAPSGWATVEQYGASKPGGVEVVTYNSPSDGPTDMSFHLAVIC